MTRRLLLAAALLTLPVLCCAAAVLAAYAARVAGVDDAFDITWDDHDDSL